jgi:hypothetical protein
VFRNGNHLKVIVNRCSEASTDKEIALRVAYTIIKGHETIKKQKRISDWYVKTGRNLLQSLFVCRGLDPSLCSRNPLSVTQWETTWSSCNIIPQNINSTVSWHHSALWHGSRSYAMIIHAVKRMNTTVRLSLRTLEFFSVPRCPERPELSLI